MDKSEMMKNIEEQLKQQEIIRSQIAQIDSVLNSRKDDIKKYQEQIKALGDIIKGKEKKDD